MYNTYKAIYKLSKLEWTDGRTFVLLELLLQLKTFRKTPFTIQRRKIEMQRNLWLASAQLSFLLLVGNNEVGDSICEIFGGITHLVWTFFWVWTGFHE